MLTLLLSLWACAPHHGSPREARQEARELRRESLRLSDSARLYWEGMRWEDEGRVVPFIEDVDARTAWLADAPVVRTQTRFRSAEVIAVDVGPVPTDPAQPRRAVVTVQAQIYSDEDPVLRTSTRVQTWYRGPKGWYVEPGEELGSER